MQIPQVLIPPSAGVFSSFGLLYAEIEYYFTRTRKRLLRALTPEEVQAAVDGLEAEARARLTEDGFAPDRIEIRRSASLHYQGQSFELRVPLAAGRLDRAALLALEEAFGAEHERTYGHRAGVEEPVELVSLEVIGRGIPDTPRAASAAAAGLAPGHRDRRQAAPRLFRVRARLARCRGDQPQRPREPARRPVHRRGIRRHLPRPARLDRPARRVREYRDEARPRRSKAPHLPRLRRGPSLPASRGGHSSAHRDQLPPPLAGEGWGWGLRATPRPSPACG